MPDYYTSRRYYKVVTSQCGITIRTNAVVYSETPSVLADRYRFELTSSATGTVLVYENSLNRFRLKIFLILK